ncbi:MAG: HAD hydrolase family protein, partial [bacterium]|nr:HAD hydrolase family protein [bacterium]
DVDGVLTNGELIFDSNGVETKHFHAHDGLGVRMASLAGLQTGVLSARDSLVVRRRAEQLGMDHILLGRQKKLPAFREVLATTGLRPEEVCFLGDDLVDIPVLRAVGLAVSVPNAVDATKDCAHYVTRRAGGEGAFREAVELVLRAQGRLDEAVEKLWAED